MKSQDDRLIPLRIGWVENLEAVNNWVWYTLLLSLPCIWWHNALKAALGLNALSNALKHNATPKAMPNALAALGLNALCNALKPNAIPNAMAALVLNALCNALKLHAIHALHALGCKALAALAQAHAIIV